MQRSNAAAQQQLLSYSLYFPQVIPMSVALLISISKSAFPHTHEPKIGVGNLKSS